MDARGGTRSQSVVGCSADSPDEIKVAQAGKKMVALLQII